MSERRVVTNFRATPEMIREARMKRLRAKRRRVIGGIIGITAGVSALGVGCSNIMGGGSSDGPIVEPKPIEEPYSITTSTDDLSTLNVVLVNDGISYEQMKQAEDSLKAVGLDVEVRFINELNKDGTECFVALRSYQGDDYKVIGNYNKGNNHADLLAIGMKEAFGGNIQKGVYALSGEEPTLIPSDIEAAVGDQMMPNVTIAVPKDADLEDYGDGVVKVDTGLNDNFTDSILEGIARYNDSLKYVDIYDGQFLLRPDVDELPIPTDYKNSVDSEVLKLNGLNNSFEVQKDSILLNKGLPKSFDKSTTVNVEMVNVKGNSLN